MQNYTDIFIILLLTPAAATALFTLFSVSISYLLYWYELGNLYPEKLANRFNPASLFSAAILFSAECCACWFSYLIYPLGWLPWGKSRIATDQPLIILLHGLYLNRASCFYLQLHLRQRGYQVISINLPPWKGIERLTERLDLTIADAHQQGLNSPIILIGHSMGGIIARNYVQRRGGARHIHHCITLGTPHFGSKLVPLALTHHAHDLAPKSSFIEQLSQWEWPDSVGFTSIYSETDNIILPPGRSRHPRAVNHAIGYCGHISLLYHWSCLTQLHQTLSEVICHDSAN